MNPITQCIKNFMERRKDIILDDDHKAIFEKFQVMCNKVENVPLKMSAHGVHYVTCIWSKDYATEGPDTCMCTNLILIRDKCIKLMNLYFRLYKDN